MQTVLITGGTGLVGDKLSAYLVEQGYKIIILTRSPDSHKDKKGIKYAAWDVNSGKIDIQAVQQSDFIIHLAGAPVMEKRWTASFKKEILESRTKSSLLLTDTLRNNAHHVQAIISSSAIGWYGPDKKEGHFFKEDEPADPSFLGQTCLLWEQSIETAEKQNVRVCKLRTGIVLAPKGGALEEFIKPLKLGVATIIGNGKQIISWIHIDDLCRMFHHAITGSLSGSFNAVAPEPVSNKKLVLTLAKLMKGKFYIPLHVPVPLLKLVLGERSVEILKSATVSAEKISSTGFTFSYPDIDKALVHIVKPGG
jgi:uncharacterized protein (TIGR01777 family)